MPDDLEAHFAEQREFIAQNAQLIARARRGSRFFHSEVDRLVAANVAPDSRIVDIGCGDGSLIAMSSASAAVGVDLDGEALVVAAQEGSSAQWIAGAVEELSESPLANPGYVVVSMVLDEVYDAQPVLDQVHSWCEPSTRAIVVTYSRLWRPVLRIAELLRLKARKPNESYLPRQEIENLLELSGFEITKRQDG